MAALRALCVVAKSGLSAAARAGMPQRVVPVSTQAALHASRLQSTSRSNSGLSPAEVGSASTAGSGALMALGITALSSLGFVAGYSLAAPDGSLVASDERVLDSPFGDLAVVLEDGGVVKDGHPEEVPIVSKSVPGSAEKSGPLFASGNFALVMEDGKFIFRTKTGLGAKETRFVETLPAITLGGTAGMVLGHPCRLWTVANSLHPSDGLLSNAGKVWRGGMFKNILPAAKNASLQFAVYACATGVVNYLLDRMFGEGTSKKPLAGLVTAFGPGIIDTAITYRTDALVSRGFATTDVVTGNALNAGRGNVLGPAKLLFLRNYLQAIPTVAGLAMWRELPDAIQSKVSAEAFVMMCVAGMRLTVNGVLHHAKNVAQLTDVNLSIRQLLYAAALKYEGNQAPLHIPERLTVTEVVGKMAHAVVNNAGKIAKSNIPRATIVAIVGGCITNAIKSTEGMIQSEQ